MVFVEGSHRFEQRQSGLFIPTTQIKEIDRQLLVFPPKGLRYLQSKDLEKMNQGLGKPVERLWRDIVEAKYTDGIEVKYNEGKIARHSVEVAFFAGLVGKAYGLSEAKLKMLEVAALLHDSGQILPGQILLANKEEAFTYRERMESFKHGPIGHDILMNAAVPLEIALVAQNHHTPSDYRMRYDEDIMLLTELVTIADGYVAVRSTERPWQIPQTNRQAYETIHANIQGRYNPNFFGAFDTACAEIDYLESYHQTTNVFELAKYSAHDYDKVA